MQAAFYESTGPAGEVLRIDEMEIPVPGPGEVRVRVAWSGVNPSDVKSRAGSRTRTMPFPRIIPHSDGAGVPRPFLPLTRYLSIVMLRACDFRCV